MIFSKVFETILVAVALCSKTPYSECLTYPKVSDEDAVIRFVVWYDKEKSRMVNWHAQTQWNYHTNTTAYNEEIMNQARIRLYDFTKSVYRNASHFDWQNLKNESLRRQMKEISQLDNAVLSEEKLKMLLDTEAELLEMYSDVKICGTHKIEIYGCLDYNDVAEIFATSTDESKLRRVWQRWHENFGRLIEPFKIYTTVSNEKAIHNNFRDLGAYWQDPYEWPTLEEDVRKLWEQVKPLYLQLHAYVRKKLIDIYGSDVLSPTGLIPAHLLGDILAYNWGGIEVPFRLIPSPNIAEKMKALNYTVKKIVKVAEDFFISLGFSPMPATFWQRSLFEKPKDGRNVTCHATAWNFYNKQDYRLLICGEVTPEHLYTIHHEMGHLHYFMEYKDQPYSFQDGANPAFHEAIGDVILLSVITPRHLQSIGLLNETDENFSLFHSYEADINFLFLQALPTVSTLPMSYLIDLWRWNIFRGKYDENSWNEEWWKLREKIQGLAPPVPRSPQDFDAGIIFHVVTFSPFIRYFLGELLKYQFHRALCLAAGQYDPNDPERPLFKCNIHNSKEAGHLLREMLKLGYSKHWSYALKVITQGRENKIDGSALLEYFKPLMEYLKAENELTSQHIGWGEDEEQDQQEQLPGNSGAHVAFAGKYLFSCLVLAFICVAVHFP